MLLLAGEIQTGGDVALRFRDRHARRHDLVERCVIRITPAVEQIEMGIPGKALPKPLG